MKTLLAFCILCLLSGCASYRVTQQDASATGRTITLDLRASALFSSAQSITKIKALQTDKSQSFGTDSVGQQGATNTVAALHALRDILQLISPTP